MRTPGGRHRQGRVVVVVAFAVAALVSGCSAAPPPPVDAGLPGADGPCASLAPRRVTNPDQTDLPVYIFEPTGSGSPFTGGTCSDPARPVVFFGHGYFANFTDCAQCYGTLMAHLVSNGFVVIYPGFQDSFDPAEQYRAENTGFITGAAAAPRADLGRVGFVGHSWGAGMVPRMMQLAARRGWGSEAMWSVAFAPSFPYDVGTGPIAEPANSQMLVVSFDDDVFVDMRIADDIATSVTLPAGQIEHLLIRSDNTTSPPLSADHTVPVAFGTHLGVGLDTDHLDRWGVWRPIDATAGCSLSGTWCGTDLTDMGHLSDGHVVTSGEIAGPHTDVGPPAILECGGVLQFLNLRTCT